MMPNKIKFLLWCWRKGLISLRISFGERWIKGKEIDIGT